MDYHSTNEHHTPTLSEWIDAHDEHQSDVTLRKYVGVGTLASRTASLSSIIIGMMYMDIPNHWIGHGRFFMPLFGRS